MQATHITGIYAKMEGVEHSEYKSKLQEEIGQSGPDYWEYEAKKHLENAAIANRYQVTFLILDRSALWLFTDNEKTEANLNAFAGIIVVIFHLPLTPICSSLQAV